jgi:hypothetical protein
LRSSWSGCGRNGPARTQSRDAIGNATTAELETSARGRWVTGLLLGLGIIRSVAITSLWIVPLAAVALTQTGDHLRRLQQEAQAIIESVLDLGPIPPRDEGEVL